jgi:phosphatidylglycerophosphatase A
MKTFYKIIASGFGSGFSPVAPGTCGSLVACLILYLLNLFVPAADDFYNYCLLHVLLCIFFTIIGIISVNKIEVEWGHDSPEFTVDEIVGMWFALLLIPFTWTTVLIAFALFRFFDILKPFGIRSLEKVHGGWGVMLDDILAGVYANVLLHVLLFSFQYF